MNNNKQLCLTLLHVDLKNHLYKKQTMTLLGIFFLNS